MKLLITYLITIVNAKGVPTFRQFQFDDIVRFFSAGSRSQSFGIVSTFNRGDFAWQVFSGDES